MIERREEWLELILNSLPDHVFILDKNGYYVDSYGGNYYSECFNAKSYVGLQLEDVISASKAAELQAHIDQVITTKQTLVVRYSLAKQEHLLLTMEELQNSGLPDESWFEAIITYLAPTLEHPEQVMWSVRNVTQTHLLEKQLKKLSETDELTGVLNRRAFLLELERTLEQSNSSVCLMIDIDHFKQINDMIGHLSGDEVIKHVAQVCQTQIRSSDYIGRLGGEEFGVILSNTNAIQAFDVAERIRLSVNSTACSVDGHEIYPTVSIGVAEYDSEVSSAKSLLINADKAMYYSKRTGRDQVTLYHDGLPDLKISASAKTRILKVS